MQCRTTSAHINQLPGEQPDKQSETEDNHLFSIRAMQGLGKASKVSVLVQGRNGSAQLKSLPDSGADISAADKTILIKLGEHVDNLLPSRENHAYSVDAWKLIGQLHVTIPCTFFQQFLVACSSSGDQRNNQKFCQKTIGLKSNR